MTQHAIELFDASLPPVDRGEVLRYLRARESGEVDALIEDCLAECEGALTGAGVCYCRAELRFENGFAVIFGQTIESHDLARALAGCREVLLLGATVGVGMDRLIAKYSRLCPSRALCLDAIGDERIEALCDAFCAQMQQKTGSTLGMRFSPGYGDLPLSYQRELFAILDCPRKIGLTLGESLLMSPSKSVTALVGIS
ncbi:MAG: Vitamin B12 dependent methionine synthase activation subunit [Clostridia bacterium]|nr:Vitamin B12 dependent methionine synthase activation subunit [Clostridia bacterium]